MDAAALIRRFEATHSHAAALARWSCLPVRVSPAFLRLARMRLLPQASSGDEADLWLSELVESRSGAGFAYRAAVRMQLREDLRDDGDALQRVWQTVHHEHAAWLTARGRLEEELTWRLLRDAADPEIETLWAGVVRELDAGDNAEGVARWVTRAVPDLPPGTLEHPSGRLAFHGAHLLLGDASALGDEPQRFLDAAEFAFATRRLPRRRVYVGLTPDRLLVSPLQAIEHGHQIEVPATRPLWLQVEADPSGDSPEVLTIADEAPLAHPLRHGGAIGAGLSLRLIDGSLFMLRPGRASRDEAARYRAARVQIEYDVEIYGAEKKIQLPFVIGVLADLSGQRARDEPLPPLEDRKFVHIDADNFDAVMARVGPSLAFQVDNRLERNGTLAVALRFDSMADWTPAGIVRQWVPYRHWARIRGRLEELSGALRDGQLDFNRLLRLAVDRTETERLAALVLAGDVGQLNEVQRDAYNQSRDRLATTLGIEDRELASKVHLGVIALARARAAFSLEAMFKANPDNGMADDPAGGLADTAAEIGRRLAEQLDLVLHHPDFQRLEGSWRGLHLLVRRTETDETLKIRVLNVGKAELLRSLRRTKGTHWDQNPLFRKIYDEEFGQFGGEPYGLLVGDYEFGFTAADVDMLGSLATIASAAHAPFLAGAAPALLQMDSWQDLAAPRALRATVQDIEHAAWRSLRESDDARYIGLAVPRVLARLPYYRSRDDPQAIHAEDTAGGDASRYTWTSAAYAMASNIAASFKAYGWCSRIRGIEAGGAVTGWPSMARPGDDGSAGILTPAEIAISDRREAELASLGLMPLMSSGGIAAFIGAQSLQQPTEYDDPDATANANLAARWPYLFACSRFMHYLHCIVRDKIGSHRTAEEWERYLNDWINAYIDGDPERSSEATKALRPLAAAQVTVEPVEGQPAYWAMKAYLRPHYQLAGLTVSLRLVGRIPAAPTSSQAA